MSDYRGNRVVPKLIKNNGTNNILLDLLLNYNVPISVNGTLNVAGIISGQKGISLSSVSNGTLNLSNQNTYAGSTIINSGTLKLSGSGSLGGPSATHSSNMVINGTLDYSSSVDQILGCVIDTVAFNQNSNCQIIVNGPGILHFRNPFRRNLFNGTLQINSGAYVKVGNNDATGSIDAVTSIITNGTLEFNRGTGSSHTNVNGSISGSGLIKLTGAGSIIITSGGNFSGNVLLNAGTSLTLNRIMNSAIFENNGTLTLNVTSSWNPNYVFNTTIDGNTTSLIYSTDYVAGTSIGAANITAQVQSAGFGNNASEFVGFVPGRIALVQRGVESFQVKVNNAIAAGASAVIIYNNTTGLTIPSLTTNIPVVMITQSLGEQFVAALNSTTVSCRIDTSSSSVPFSNTISGNGTIVKSGDTTLFMNIGSAYTGIISVTGGVLRVNNANGFGGATSIRPSTGAFEALGNIIVANPFSLGGTGVSSGGAIRNISDNNTLSGPVALTTASRINSDSGLLVLGGTVSGAFGLTIGGAGSTRVDGAITTPTTLTKDGAGTLELTAANTYTSTTTISAGTLRLSGSGTVGAGNITNNANLVIENNDGTTISRAISGTGTLTKNLNTKVIFTGTLSHTGVTTVNAGTFAVGAGGTTGDMSGSGSVVVNSGTTLEINRSNASTFSRPLSGSGSLVVLGGGTASFTGAITHTGGTTVSAGTMSIGAGSTTGSITGDIVNNATLQFNRSDSYTYAGVISGTGGVTKSAAGTTTLSGNNTYSGTTTISAGALRVAHANALGSATSTVSLPASTAIELTGGLTFSRNLSSAGTGISSGGSLRNISGNNTFNGNYTQTAASRINSDADTLTLSNSGTLTGAFGLTLGGAGNILVQRPIATSTGTLTKDGAGTVTLTEDNTYTGTTTVSVGTLVVGNGGTTGTVTSVSVAAVATLTFNRSNDYTYAGVLSSTGSVVKQGAGSLILTGASTHTGSLTVSQGILQIGNGSTTGSTTSSIVNNASVVFNRSNASTHSAVISGTGSVTNSGTGTTTLSGANTYTGGTTISAGGITIGAGSTSGSIVGDVTNNGTLTFNRSDSYTYAGVISGTGGVTKSAAGTTTLSGNNAYSGTTTISAGALRIAHTNALGSATSTVSLPSNTAIELAGGLTFSRNLSSAGTGISSGGSLRNISGNNTFNGNYTQTAASRINSDAGILTLGSAGTLTGTFGLTFGGAGDILVQRPIATSTGAVTKDGVGTLVLSAANTYSGVTTISGGTVRFALASALYNNTTASWTKTNIVVNTGATFAINVGGTNEFTTSNVSTLLTNLLTTINNNGLRSGSSIGFDTSNSPSDFTISSNITNSTGTGAGAVGVVKLGTGTLVLSGTGNTYTGGTVINGGTLKAGNATCFGTGTITLNAGATLDLSGFTITNAIVNNGGTIIN
jgi:autotransporter-associated beta strand protein